ncbi:MAG: helicase-exonuclease AddAB subunit AddB [Eubacteriales bacterium]
MSLQLILGNSGAGKTHYLYERVIEESIANPNRNYLIIVPEQFTMQTQKELVMRHPRNGIMNIDVLSFGRLAHRIYEEVGKPYETMLDDEGKNLVIRKIAGNYQSELKVIGKNLNKFGYISEVKSIISEFTQYDISMQKMKRIREQLEENSMLAYKLDDIATIREGFQEYLEEHNCITGEELLDKLSRVVHKSKILQDSVITFDGFTGFTPVQNRLMKELLKVSNCVYLTVTIDEHELPYSYSTGQELFALSKETIKNVTQLSKECGVEIIEPIILGKTSPYRFRENKAMAFLESELFRYGTRKYEENQEQITMHLLRNPEEEARWVASEIRRLVRQQEIRYQDIAIISSSMESYGTYIKRACESYDIPIFTDQKRSILLNSFVEYVRSLLAMMEQNYTYESVFRFLKSGFGPITEERVDALETYILSRGIKGYKSWQAPWIDETSPDETMNQLNESRVRFVENIQNLQGVLKERKKTVEDICVALYQFFVEGQIQYKIENLENTLQESGELALSKEYSQIYSVVLELFDKFVALLGEEVVGLREFNDLFDAGMQEARIGIIPPSIDSVVVGDLTRTRISNVKIVIFMGANDTYLPGNMNTSGLLSERDRAWFEKKEIRLKPSGKEQMYIQKLYLYLILTKPSQRLYISLSKTNAEGKSTRPAYLIGEIRKLFKKLKIQEEVMTLSSTELTKGAGIIYLIEGLRNTELQRDEKWKELYAWYARNDKWKSQLELIVKANQYCKSEDRLTSEIAKALYGEILKNSVTRLEQFAACPYAHFLRYGLRLKEREIHEFEAVDLGNIFHESIEYYSRKVREHHVEWKEISREQQEEWANEAVEYVAKNYEYGLLTKSERDQYNIERMKRLMRRSVWAVSKQIACGEFAPEGFEVAFGEESDLESTKIQLGDNQTMILRGKIDRVDTYEEDGTTYVKIVDYKTGTKELSLGDLYHGLQLQLFVYLNAAIELKKREQDKVVPAGVLYYRMDDPLVEMGSSERIMGNNENREAGRARIEQGVLESLTPDGMVNEAANILSLLDEEFEGRSYAIPVTKDAKGEIKKSSNVISTEDFEAIEGFTKQKIQEIGQEIVDGNINIEPYRDEKHTGCGYCKYNQICGFDSKVEGYAYRKIEKSTMSKALELIKNLEEGAH